MATIWSSKRKSPPLDISKIVHGAAEQGSSASGRTGRSAFQKDYDRILFSTPVRRLSDKTQVWPMDDNDGVRSRLTHSHEVANLARSIGTQVYRSDKALFDEENLHETIQPILSAIGLAHDLGNPPFGHQGEAAIQRWFGKREGWIFSKDRERDDAQELAQPIPDPWRREFLNFDGNPQSLRLLAKLQTSVARVGLDLTAATLAASLKYPVGADKFDKKNPIAKKVGYFQSEKSLVEWIRSETGLRDGERHPLTWIMEACDDIAYSVLDVEDAMKKGVVSPDDVFEILKQVDSIPNGLLKKISSSFEKVTSTNRLPKISRDVKISYLKAHFLDALVDQATAAFLTEGGAIASRSHAAPLMDKNPLCDTLKDLARDYAFADPRVLKMEAIGGDAVDTLLTAFWDAIISRKDEDLQSRRTSAKAAYVFSLISPNYLEDAMMSKTAEGVAGVLRYRELRLLTDMISGMTDTFAVKLATEIKALP